MYSLIISFIVANCVLTVFNKDNDDDDDDALTHNTLCSSQPAYLRSLLNYHTPTLTCCLFLVFTLPLPPVSLVLQACSLELALIWRSSLFLYP